MGIVSETKAAIRGREHEVLPVLQVSPPRRGKMRCPTLTHDDRDPSWRWDERRGRWHCTCGGGDILDLVQAMGYANSPVSAAIWVREVLGLPPIEGQRRQTPAERAAAKAKQAELCRQAEIDRAERDAEDAEEAARQLRTVRQLLCKAMPIPGTPVEIYLREYRKITCGFPATLGALPPGYFKHGAMIAAFGLATEPESDPGGLTIKLDDIWGVHLTFVHDDGSPASILLHGKSERKITLGRGHDLPIVLAPPNDGLGLVICEGIEDALSFHQHTGLGAWASGTAGRLPGLARHVPGYIETVTLIEDDDDAGRKGCEALARLLVARGIEVRIERGGPQ